MGPVAHSWCFAWHFVLMYCCARAFRARSIAVDRSLAPVTFTCYRRGKALCEAAACTAVLQCLETCGPMGRFLIVCRLVVRRDPARVHFLRRSKNRAA